MGKKKDGERKRAGRLSQLLEVPLDLVADVPRMTLYDNQELSVENYKSIESYTGEEICLQSGTYRIIISGKLLEIVTITDEEILIRGTIEGLSLR